jgi:hypothetical protein
MTDSVQVISEPGKSQANLKRFSPPISQWGAACSVYSKKEDGIMANFEVVIAVAETDTIRTNYNYRVRVRAESTDAARKKLKRELRRLKRSELAHIPAHWLWIDSDKESNVELEFKIRVAEESNSAILIPS